MSRPYLQDGSLIVRLAETSDIPALLHYHLSNRAALAPFSPRRSEQFYSAEYWQLQIALSHSHFEQARSCRLSVFEPDNRSVIGEINFSNLVPYPFYAATLGYSLDPAHWGRGRMHQALTLALDFVFEHFNLHRVMANYLPDNQRSARLLERLGFEREGLARDYLLIDGVWRDHVLTALTRRGWSAHDGQRELIENGNGGCQT
ncbi:GNAT family N-acetyltransferase [Chitinimonas lacunae]|uniref:GNAT family N-acetyltransferase n=1 Tax=Chitinimonas lacunae TaxID=1963018 RepID=A0ABV8MW23_9NEIS